MIKKYLLFSRIKLRIMFVIEPNCHFVTKITGNRAVHECMFKGIWTSAKKAFIVAFNLESYLPFLVINILRRLLMLPNGKKKKTKNSVFTHAYRTEIVFSLSSSVVIPNLESVRSY